MNTILNLVHAHCVLKIVIVASKWLIGLKENKKDMGQEYVSWGRGPTGPTLWTSPEMWTVTVDYTGIRWWIMIVGAADHRLIAAGLPDI